MPQIDKHEPGEFCWIELSTNDQTAAKKFYGDVFGWTPDDSPMGPDQYYTMFKLGGLNVGAAYTQQKEEVTMGVPPHWNLYIQVVSTDDAVKKATELGGTLIAGPFDVMTHGRMAVIADPQGAMFEVWQSFDHSGLQVKNQHGALCWADLNAPDQEASAKFYGSLFGWTFTPGDGGYLHIKNAGKEIGGVPPSVHMPPNAPPHWMIYLQTDDCDTTVAKARAGGAKVCMGPMTMENIGRLAVLTDPQAAALAVFQPAPRQ